MEYRIEQDCDGVDWEEVSQILRSVDMAFHDADVHRRAFEASYSTAFVYRADRLVGFDSGVTDSFEWALR